MKRLFFLLLAMRLVSACSEDAPATKKAELRLVRTSGGEIAVELDRAPVSVRAIELELEVQGDGAFELADAAPAARLPLDTVRLQMNGTNRAILFAGSKREVLIPRSGAVATFSVRGSGANARLLIARAVVADRDGNAIETELGPG